jgi:putative methyltransferase (TIGR04325 family)
MKYKEIIKNLIPPFFLKIYYRLTSKYGYYGNYASWNEAAKVSTGYDSQTVLEKVKGAMLKVRQGTAVSERDSVTFDRMFLPWPLLSGLLYIASKMGNRLNIVDFGGSLGTSYFQCRGFLRNLSCLNWSVIEQPHFVSVGKQYFENDHLKFYDDLQTCVENKTPDVILFSSVIQYLEDPYRLLEMVTQWRIEYLIFDRTPFLEMDSDRITVQKVSPDIYEASYPAWFFNLKKFEDFFLKDYELIAEFDSLDRANIPSVFKGFIFKLKSI